MSITVDGGGKQLGGGAAECLAARGVSRIRIRARIHAYRKGRKINTPLGAALCFRVAPRALGRLRQARNSREPVESSIEAENSVDAVLLHHRQMHCIARRQAFVTEHNFFGTLDD